MASASVKDVAALAGVSVGTVSNVLNRPEIVSDAALRRVQRAIDELGFVRNNAARQLRAGQSSTIGMVILDVANPFFASVVRGAEDRADDDGFSVLVGNADESEAREIAYLDMFEQERIRGVLIAPFGNVMTQLERLRRRGIPSVLVDRTSLDRSFTSVSVDDVAGGTIAAAHLIDNGYERIAFVGGPFAIRQVFDRFSGAQLEVERRYPGRLVERVETASLTIGEGQRVGSLIAARRREDRPDAVFAANDMLAIGLLQSLSLNGLTVPSDLALIGYDDIAFASAAVVPLSSIRQPSVKIGATAMDLLLRLSADPQTPATHVEYQPSLVERSSTRRA